MVNFYSNYEFRDTLAKNFNNQLIFKFKMAALRLLYLIHYTETTLITLSEVFGFLT